MNTGGFSFLSSIQYTHSGLLRPTTKTADFYDRYEKQLQVCTPVFQHFGGHRAFHGRIVTLKCFEDNSLVAKHLREPGEGRVLVVDAGGSLRCAMLGDILAQKAFDKGWAGVMFGCIRDCEDIGKMPLGVLAFAANPRKSIKKGVWEAGIPVEFAGIVFRGDEW